MRISFICGTFADGRDGVGDYVARFAAGLMERGHAVQVIAIADRVVAEVTASSGAANVPETLRIPAAEWRRGRIEAAVNMLDAFRPDWTSLQLVPTAYEPHGVLIRTPWRLRRLPVSGRRHLMLHELWFGDATGSSIKHRILGGVQRRLVVRAIGHWNPELIHTSNAVYRELLRRNRIDADILRLPANIPANLVRPSRARGDLMAKCGFGGSDAAWLLAGVFGSVHPEWAEPRAFGPLVDAASRAGYQLAIVHFGRMSGPCRVAWCGLRQGLSNTVPLVDLGEMSPQAVSATVQALDIGLAATPWALIEKSGTVATLLDHGVPVLVTRDDYQLRHGPTPVPHGHALLARSADEVLAMADRRRRGEAAAATSWAPWIDLDRALTKHASALDAGAQE